MITSGLAKTENMNLRRRARDLAELVQKMWYTFGWKTFHPGFILPAVLFTLQHKEVPRQPSLVPQPLTFPVDHAPHEAGLEWWYFNGFFDDSTGTPHAFHHVVFLAKPHLLGLPQTFRTRPHETVIFSQIINLTTGASTKHSFMSRQTDIKQTTDGFNLLFDNGQFIHSLVDGFKFHLDKRFFHLVETTKPIPVHTDGFIPFADEPMFYYSLPRLNVRGLLDDQQLSGISWMDHQWGANVLQGFRWVWWNGMLDDGTNIIACQHGTKNVRAFVTISSPAGRVITAHDAVFDPLDNHLIGQRSGYKYHLAWRVTVPSLDATFEVTAPGHDCELSFGLLHYYESPINIVGSISKQKVSGRGFLEIANSPNY